MTTFFILDTPIALFSLSYAEEPVWVFRVAATAADFPSGKAEPTRLGSNPIRRRQRRMRGNLPGPEGLARPFARTQPLYLGRPTDPCEGASAALHGLPVVTTTGGAARLASAPSALSNGVGQAQLHRTDIRPCQRGSRRILRQAPGSMNGCPG